MAALSKLVSLGSCGEAGLLGPGWLVLLRALSQLERLTTQLMPGAHPSLPFGNGALALGTVHALALGPATALLCCSAVQPGLHFIAGSMQKEGAARGL